MVYVFLPLLGTSAKVLKVFVLTTTLTSKESCVQSRWQIISHPKTNHAVNLIGGLLLYSGLRLTFRIGENMNTPLYLAFLALFTGGISTFMWKVGGTNGVYAPSYIIWANIFAILVAVIIHLVQKQAFELSPSMAGIASVGGFFGGICVWATLRAFALGGEGSIIFPIIGLAVMLSTTLSFVIYREPATATKILGLGFGAASIFFLSR